MVSPEEALIFVSIAAYRDPQLGATVADCLRKAQHPGRVRFGLCWQRDEEDEQLAGWLGDRRFRVLVVHWRDSRGACWARAEIMKLWRGEDWFLQVDSHCRFAQGWDVKLIQGMEETGSPKPLLSTYANPFTPGPIEILLGAPLQILFQAFTPEGIPQLKPAGLPSGGVPGRPSPARFLAAGFLFAAGTFVEEVPYDSDLYFMGEEAAMTVRAYTHGYDLFHPGEAVLWHDYMRHDSRKHWGDHTAAAEVARPWGEMDKESRSKVQRLLLGEPVGSFGLGAERTLEQYEAYAGLSFRLRKAHPYTVRGAAPPNPEPAADWAEKIQPWITKIIFERERLPAGSLEDPVYWCIGIEDARGCELCRVDAGADQLAPFLEGDGNIVLVCEFPSDAVPAVWTVQPLSRSRGWLQRIRGPLGEGDLAVLADEDVEEMDCVRSEYAG